jgi:hypothetical protein
MPASNPYGADIDIVGPASNAEVVTPSDSADLTHVSRALYVGVAGNMSVVMRGGQTVTFAVQAGIHPLAVSRVRATGTTATGIVAVW